MYTGELNGMTLTLPDEDYEILKKRLMVSKAVEVDGYYTIDAPCLCEKYDTCGQCPFWSRQAGAGCGRFRRMFVPAAVVNTSIVQVVSMNTVEIGWFSRNDREARTVIKSMRKALLGMKYVKA